MPQGAAERLAQHLLGPLALALPHRARQRLLRLAAAARRRGGHRARRAGPMVARVAAGVAAACVQAVAGVAACRHRVCGRDSERGWRNALAGVRTFARGTPLDGRGAAGTCRHLRRGEGARRRLCRERMARLLAAVLAALIHDVVSGWRPSQAARRYLRRRFDHRAARTSICRPTRRRRARRWLSARRLRSASTSCRGRSSSAPRASRCTRRRGQHGMGACRHARRTAASCRTSRRTRCRAPSACSSLRRASCRPCRRAASSARRSPCARRSSGG